MSDQTETTLDTDEVVVRPFAAVLQEINGGRLHTELSNLLHEVVAAVNDTGKKGVLSLKLTVQPMKKGQPGTLLVSDQVASSIPKADRLESIFFADATGNLTRKDPNQIPFQLEGLPTESDLEKVNLA